MNTRIDSIRAAAHRIRLNALEMGEVQGQGYVGQALGVAAVLAHPLTDACYEKVTVSPVGNPRPAIRRITCARPSRRPR